MRTAMSLYSVPGLACTAANKAIADYAKAIRLDPNYALAYYSRGSAYLDKAIADYSEGIRLYTVIAESS